MELIDALAISRLEGVGDSSVVKLINFSTTNQFNKLENLIDADLRKLVTPKAHEELRRFLNSGDIAKARSAVETDLALWQSEKIHAICLNSRQYPKQLLMLRNPPPFLFCKGNLNLLTETKSIAVVGTRNNSSRGEIITQRTVGAFQRQNFVVVSGLAIGIDAIAHKAAIDSGLHTVAIVVDLEKISPRKNKPLASEILESGGLLISENEPGTPSIGPLFAKRDRIQAGLSTAVFAIETSSSGGTMHAVRTSHKIGRSVYVPDPLAAGYNDLSLPFIEGTQKLILEGIAKPYTKTSYEEIIHELLVVSEQLRQYSSTDNQGKLPV